MAGRFGLPFAGRVTGLHWRDPASAGVWSAGLGMINPGRRWGWEWAWLP